MDNDEVLVIDKIFLLKFGDALKNKVHFASKAI